MDVIKARYFLTDDYDRRKPADLFLVQSQELDRVKLILSERLGYGCLVPGLAFAASGRVLDFFRNERSVLSISLLFSGSGCPVSPSN